MVKMFLWLFSAGAVGFLLSLGGALGMRGKKGGEELSVFECGFNSCGTSRIPFSLHFFLMSILFLVFDVELILMFPALLGEWAGSPGLMKPALAAFILFMSFTTLYEWLQGSLEWAA